MFRSDAEYPFGGEMKLLLRVVVDRQELSDDVMDLNNDTSHLECPEISTSCRRGYSHVANAINTVAFVATLVSCFRLTLCRDVVTQQGLCSLNVTSRVETVQIGVFAA